MGWPTDGGVPEGPLPNGEEHGYSHGVVVADAVAVMVDMAFYGSYSTCRCPAADMEKKTKQQNPLWEQTPISGLSARATSVDGSATSTKPARLN